MMKHSKFEISFNAILIWNLVNETTQKKIMADDNLFHSRGED